MAKLTDYLGRPHSGIVPHAVIAIVKDNVDPDELGRVQVTFPTLQDEPASYWLRVASPNAGDLRGFYSLPEIGDEVLVLFMQGSQDVGVIIGGFWNGKHKPPTEAKDGMPAASGVGGSLAENAPKDGSGSLDTNDRRFWRSRSGHLIVMDDSDGKESVQIWDGQHKLALVFDGSQGVIVLSNGTGAINIHATGDLTLESDANIKMKAGQAFELEAGTEAKAEAGTTFDIKAGSDLTAEGTSNATFKAGVDAKVTGTNVTVEASAQLNCKGSATGTFDGGGMCTLKGSMVMIN
jgi:uncharacterized protein involved in type VI secretion and phage assembly